MKRGHGKKNVHKPGLFLLFVRVFIKRQENRIYEYLVKKKNSRSLILLFTLFKKIVALKSSNLCINMFEK